MRVVVAAVQKRYESYFLLSARVVRVGWLLPLLFLHNLNPDFCVRRCMYGVMLYGMVAEGQERVLLMLSSARPEVH